MTVNLNARWYDSALSLFTQADTLVPEPLFPLDWNRYLYARANPMRFTDPSGHEACDEDGFCYDHGKMVSSPTPKLTEKGKEIRDLFHQFLETDGWWSSSGKFGVNEFLGKWILFESTSSDAITWIKQANLVVTAIAQNLFVGGWNDKVGASYNAIYKFYGIMERS